MRVIVFANFKGGVTKTTSSLNLAAMLGYAKKSVLLVDTDAQCNSTSFLLRGKTRRPLKEISPSIYDVLLDDKGQLPLAKVIRQRTREENVQLLPSSKDVATIDISLSRQPTWGMSLARRRAELDQLGYDVVIVDTPPTSAFIKTLSLYAADLAILPTVPSAFSLDALVDMIEEIAQIQQSTGRTIDFRFLLTRVKSTINSDKIRQQLQDTFGGRVLSTEIPEATIVTRAEEHAQSLLRYAPSSKPAIAYVELLKEILPYVQ